MSRYVFKRLKVPLFFGRSLTFYFRFKSRKAVGQHFPLKWSTHSMEIELTYESPHARDM
jgi:hypothetical protein